MGSLRLQFEQYYSENANETAALGIERTESVIEEQSTETIEVEVDSSDRDVIVD